MWRACAGPALALAMLGGCSLEVEPDGRDMTVEYRDGTAQWGYTSSGERGNVQITEIHWAGSMRGDRDGWVHDPGDVFIELQNRHPRPISMRGWQLTILTGPNLDTWGPHFDRFRRANVTYVLETPEGDGVVEPNGYVVIAARRDGAFRNADYYIEDLVIPRDPFAVTLQDRDNRLIDRVLDERKIPFAGSWDGVTARSMERTQLLFANRGEQFAAWHSYSLNDWDTVRGQGERLHVILRQFVHEEFRTLTFATPGMPNSPDYSGMVSSGNFE